MFVHMAECGCMRICVQVCLVTVSLYLSQWVVTVKVFHLVGLLSPVGAAISPSFFRGTLYLLML